MSIKNSLDHYSTRLLFLLSLIWAGVLLLIGGWWIYLILNFETIMGSTERSRIKKMLIWEGGSFLVLLLLLSTSLLILYLKDQKKTKSLQAFFASLTHELKTPLASIRLQGEVINELLTTKNDASLIKLSSRLIEDTGKLENQMDKILQLSRLERGGELNLTSLKIIPFIKSISKEWASGLTVNIESDTPDATIIADEFALELMIKNLFENTRIHTKSRIVKIKIEKKTDIILLTYQDEGEFNGDITKLGSLFYKHNSGKGSGIGLYLTKQLINKMHGSLDITNNRNLVFSLTFKSSEDNNA